MEGQPLQVGSANLLFADHFSFCQCFAFVLPFRIKINLHASLLKIRSTGNKQSNQGYTCSSIYLSECIIEHNVTYFRGDRYKTALSHTLLQEQSILYIK